jgi:hypothetical protein
LNRLTSLTTALLDLLHALEGADVPLIIGGGFGIYLRYTKIAEEGLQTLFAELPEPRSTNDLDLFLRAELLLDSSRLRPLRDALRKLGYEVIEGAEHYQFFRADTPGATTGIKIDVLTGPTSSFRGTRVKFDDRRVRPSPSVKLHAHPVEEALSLVERLSPRELAGRLSGGSAFRGAVYLPHPFTFLTMKLFALRDQVDDAENDFGRRHALDLYAVIGSMAPAEWDECLAMRDRYSEHAIVRECGRIVAELFGSTDTPGTLRLRESPYFRASFDLGEFLQTLAELFPVHSG